MPVMDEFQEERSKMKQATLSEKLSYFWSYYKLHTIGGLIALILVSMLIHDIISRKDTLFFAAILNCVDLDANSVSDFANEFTDFAGINKALGDVIIDSTISVERTPTSEISLASSQKMMVYTTSGELDIIVGGSDVFGDYANTDVFADLREILSSEQLAKYEPYFYYVDMADIRDMNDSAEIFSPDYVAPVPKDPAAPEDMREPVPVGLFVTDSQKLKDTYYFTGQDYVAVGVVVNGSHTQNALAFIDFLFE